MKRKKTAQSGAIPRLKREQIKQFFNGKNLMTPKLIRLGQCGKLIFELTQGTDFKHRPIVGISVKLLSRDRGEIVASKNYDEAVLLLSRCFEGTQPKQQAKKYIEQIIKPIGLCNN